MAWRVDWGGCGSFACRLESKLQTKRNRWASCNVSHQWTSTYSLYSSLKPMTDYHMTDIIEAEVLCRCPSASQLNIIRCTRNLSRSSNNPFYSWPPWILAGNGIKQGSPCTDGIRLSLVTWYVLDRSLSNLNNVLTPSSAASTDVERAFSKGRLNVSRLRHSLSDESTRAATVLGSWAEIPGLVRDDELVKHIKDKQFSWGKHSGGNDVMEID